MAPKVSDMPAGYSNLSVETRIPPVIARGLNRALGGTRCRERLRHGTGQDGQGQYEGSKDRCQEGFRKKQLDEKSSLTFLGDAQMMAKGPV